MFILHIYKSLQGTTLTFAPTCPVGQVRFPFTCPTPTFTCPLKCVCFIVSFGTKWKVVLACESILSRTSLDARPQNLHTFSTVNTKYIQRTCPVGQARYSFHLPLSYNLQILLARGKHQCWALHCVLIIYWLFPRLLIGYYCGTMIK